LVNFFRVSRLTPSITCHRLPNHCMKTLLYISASPYSGSTLLSFLLNTHPEIVTIGHATGWEFPPEETFFCSCGQPIENCPFYSEVRRRFDAERLPFDYRDFGNRYVLSRNARINRLLIGRLPFAAHTPIERLRDAIVQTAPYVKSRMDLQDRANRVIFNTALTYNRSKVFVDNSHDPYRLKNLRRLSEFSLINVHLIRDPRGVAWSNMRHKNWSASTSSRLWLRRQRDIARIAGGKELNLILYYEELCHDPNTQLQRLYSTMGLAFSPFEGDFKQGEHHILGNDMRLGRGAISTNESWRVKLPLHDQRVVEDAMRRFIASNPADDVCKFVRHYFPNF
jgi:hypothetical protein